MCGSQMVHILREFWVDSGGYKKKSDNPFLVLYMKVAVCPQTIGEKHKPPQDGARLLSGKNQFGRQHNQPTATLVPFRKIKEAFLPGWVPRSTYSLQQQMFQLPVLAYLQGQCNLPVVVQCQPLQILELANFLRQRSQPIAVLSQVSPFF